MIEFCEVVKVEYKGNINFRLKVIGSMEYEFESELKSNYEFCDVLRRT